MKKIVKLKEKLDSLIANNEWEACEILPDVYSESDSSIRDCIVYYVCGYVTRKILKHKKCPTYIELLNSGDIAHKSGELVVTKSNGQLIHPNKFLSSVEHSFSKHCEALDVFEILISDVTINISTPALYI